MPTALRVTREAMVTYRATARERWEQEREETAQRQQRAWLVARQAAALIKEQFGASRIVAFGSLTHDGTFTRWSDIDLAAWDIAPEDTLQAIGTAYDIEAEFQVNLVDIETCLPSLRAVIEQEGIEL
jgi:predicted nucleotidyltransferase